MNPSLGLVPSLSNPLATERARARILLVDDDAQVRTLCRRILSARGHEIVEAASGERAATRLGEGFDLVLSDLDMPGCVNGNQLTRLARAGSGSDVLIMTGNPAVETAIQALRDGAYDYIVKPFNAEHLRRAVDRCLEKRRLAQDLAAANERLRATFGQFVAPEVARYALAHREPVRTEGELRVLTTLFVDVRGFTTYSAKVSPRAVVSVLNQIFERVVEAVQAEGGVLNKFIGDGMLALFGAPTPCDDHAARAARAARAAMRAVEELARSRDAEGLVPLRLGMGLNTGEVVAGFLGTSERAEYSVIGDPVNVTSRLESLAKPGQILVGPETAARLRPSFPLADRGLCFLKGRPEPVQVEELLWA